MSELAYSFCRRVFGKRSVEWVSNSFFRVFRHFPLRKDVLMFRTEGDFCDNGRALYEYLANREDKKRRFVWAVNEPKKFTNRKNTVFLSPNKGFRLRYFYYLAVAKNILETHNLTQIQVRPGQNYICLWHGMPMKLQKNPSEFPAHSFNHLICLSHNTILNHIRFLNCDNNLAIPLGYPRNDLLTREKSDGLHNPLSEEKYSKVIIWMPTFRASINSLLSEEAVDTDTGLPLLTDLSSIKDLSRFLNTCKVLLIIKIHHLQAGKDVFNRQFENIMFIQDKDLLAKDIQLYEMMAKTDALLTDYSSVFVDYLLLDKPIGFIVNDYNEYQKSRGIPFDNFLEMVPGQLISTVDDLKGFVASIAHNEDGFVEKRNALLHEFHEFFDGNSSQRIMDYFNL